MLGLKPKKKRGVERVNKMAIQEEPLWTPDTNKIRDANITKFINSRPCIPKSSYDALHRWSIDSPEDFWDSVWNFCGALGDRGPLPWLRNWDGCLNDSLIEAEFFSEGSFNGCQNILRQYVDDRATH